MPRGPTKSPSEIPQSQDTWIFAIRKLRTWIAPEDKEPVRPFVLITYNRSRDLIQGVKIVKKPSHPQAEKNLIAAMIHPQKGLKTGRPAKIGFDDKNLLEALRPTLQKFGIQAAYYPRAEEIDLLVHDLEAHMREDQPEIPGLLSGKGITVKMVTALFEAAADFYRETPWIQLGNDDALAIKVHPGQEWRYAAVMGQGGMEYGLAYYQDWADIERMYLAHDDPMEIIPTSGTHSFMFDQIAEIPFDDLEDIEKYGWAVAGPQAYPFPLIFRPPDQVERPDADELLWYEAVLRAIPKFVRFHLRKSSEGEIQPVVSSISVSTAAGTKTVEIKYPAGKLPLAQMTADESLFENSLDAAADAMPFDRRMMEGYLADILRDVETDNLDPKVKKAQDIMYKAWEEQNPARRLSLAHQALRESEDCADAYVLLAEEEAASLAEAFDYYDRGVAAGERTLGKEFFEENVGHFWGILESRPYMRALEGKANCLWQLKQKEASLHIYNDMLRLNPNDNQGIRYILVDLLLDMNREEEVEKLLKKYQGDGSTVWLYSETLIAFRKHGSSNIAVRRLKDALDQNPYVPDYLSGKKRIPNRLPESMTWGGESEAVDYAALHLNYWRSTPGAIEWLNSQLKKGSIRAKKTSGRDRKDVAKD